MHSLLRPSNLTRNLPAASPNNLLQPGTRGSINVPLEQCEEGRHVPFHIPVAESDVSDRSYDQFAAMWSQLALVVVKTAGEQDL